MFDNAPPLQMQRSYGHAMARFAQRGGRTTLADLAQRGSAKAMLPRVFGPHPEVVFMNTSGGLTGDDRLSFAMLLDDTTQLCATTQTAERAYASLGPPAHVQVDANLGAGARLDWLPQETILFEDAHLHRKTQIDLAEGASVLLLESLVLGRFAMKERPKAARLTDQRMVRRNGRPFWAETLRIGPDVLEHSDQPALLGGARALAVIAYIDQGAEDVANIIRSLPAPDGAQVAVSGWNGRCLIRISASDAWPMRQMIIRVVTTLRAAPMPRVWQC